jgi:hypothetical protein
MGKVNTRPPRIDLDVLERHVSALISAVRGYLDMRAEGEASSSALWQRRPLIFSLWAFPEGSPDLDQRRSCVGVMSGSHPQRSRSLGCRVPQNEAVKSTS